MDLVRRMIDLRTRARRLSFVLAAAVPIAPAGVARDLDDVARELSNIAHRVDDAEGALDGAFAPGAGRTTARRLADAEVLAALGDHAGASLLLRQLAAADPTHAGVEGVRVLQELAESLFQVGNLEVARQAFSALVSRRVHLRAAALRLIEIGDRRARWDGVDEALAALRETGVFPPDVAYAQARSLLRRGLAAQAESACRDVPPSHPLWAKTRYLAGVAAVSRAALDEAAGVFLELTSLTGPYDDLAAIRELAAMDRARLHLEQGRSAEAVRDYELVPRDSPRSPEALYELAWARVRRAAATPDDGERRAEYRRAADALELMLIADDGSALLPEARLLLGNILLHLGSYEAAGATFDDVVRRYKTVRDELLRLEAEARDPEHWFEMLAASHSDNAGALTPIALRWATRRDQLAVATRLIADLDAGEASLAEAQAAAEGLGVTLAGARESLPALRALERRQAGLEAALAGASQHLLAVERRLVSPGLRDDEAATLRQLLAERAGLADAYEAAAAERGDVETDAAERHLADVDRRTYQLRFPIRGMKDGLAVLRSWLLDNAGRLAPDGEKALRERMRLAELELQELGREQGALERALAREQVILAGVTRPSADPAVRRRFLATLGEERQLLARFRGRTGPELAPALADIDRLRAALDGQATRLAVLSTRLASEGTGRASAGRAQLATEVAEVAALRAQLEARRCEARVLVGEVVTLALAEARSRLDGILLRADLGVVDVAWRLKERQGEVIDRRVSEERRDLSALDTAIKDLLGDD